MNKDQQSQWQGRSAVNPCHEPQARCRQRINEATVEFCCLFRYFDSRGWENWHLLRNIVIDYFSDWDRLLQGSTTVNRVQKYLFLPYLPMVASVTAINISCRNIFHMEIFSQTFSASLQSHSECDWFTKKRENSK